MKMSGLAQRTLWICGLAETWVRPSRSSGCAAFLRARECRACPRRLPFLPPWARRYSERRVLLELVVPFEILRNRNQAVTTSRSSSRRFAAAGTPNRCEAAGRRSTPQRRPSWPRYSPLGRPTSLPRRSLDRRHPHATSGDPDHNRREVGERGARVEAGEARAVGRRGRTPGRSTPQLRLPAGAHWEASAGADKVVVFGLQARAVGVWVPTSDRRVRRHPEKIVGWASVDPTIQSASRSSSTRSTCSDCAA